MGPLQIERFFQVPSRVGVVRAGIAGAYYLDRNRRKTEVRVESIHVTLQVRVDALVNQSYGLRPTGGERRSVPGTSIGRWRYAVDASNGPRGLSTWWVVIWRVAA